MADNKMELHNTRIEIGQRGAIRRFSVESATMRFHRGGRRPVQLRFEGPQGVITIELPRTVAGQLTSAVHEWSIRAHATAATQTRSSNPTGALELERGRGDKDQNRSRAEL